MKKICLFLLVNPLVRNNNWISCNNLLTLLRNHSIQIPPGKKKTTTIAIRNNNKNIDQKGQV